MPARSGLLLWVLLLWLVAGNAAAQSPGGTAPAGLSFDVWPVEDGLQQNAITAIVQSRAGYLWLGTYHGLARFDGVKFTIFDSSHTPGLKNSRVTSLYEDSDGVIWIGHETGEVTRLTGGEFRPVNLKDGWPGGPIEAITTDENKDLWLLNNNGLLFRLRDGHLVTAPGGASPGQPASLTRETSGRLWIVSNGMAAGLEAGTLVPAQFDAANPPPFYEKVLPARDGGLWVLGNGRIREWRDNRWVKDLGACPCESGFVTLLLETRSGALLAGTLRDGLYILTPGLQPLHFSRTNGLSHDWVRSLCEDHEGNIWIGTGAGLATLRARKVKMLSPPDGWQGRAVLSFSLTTDSAAWIGTEGAGLYNYQQGKWDRFTESSGLGNLFVWSVLQTKRGELLAGTWGGGLLIHRGTRFEAQEPLNSITAPVLSLYEARGGELWIGTVSGLHRYEAGKLTWFAGKEKLHLPDVRAIAQSPDGTIWFGMAGGGLGSYKDGNLRQFMKQDGLISDFVLSLYADSDGTLWIGTEENGLGRLKLGKFSSVGMEQGLGDSLICQIVDDGAGNLWLGSHQGILRASKADLSRCAEGEAKSVRCLSYGKAEGMASLICSGGFQPGACKAADGRLWFPTTKGLAIVDPANVSTNPVRPPVVIEELLVEGKAIEYGSTVPLKIPPGKQRFELHYTALSFAAPDKVRFQYKLDGLEKGWIDAGTRRIALYSYLPPGSYTFHVIACNNDDLWNEAGASLAFTVLPQFWQTWWFQGISAVCGAAAFGFGVVWVARRRLRRKLELAHRQRAIERERTRIAKDIHDDLGASLTRITLLSQSARGELDDPPRAAADLDRIYGTARELTRAMDEIVWAVNPKHDTLDSLATYLGRFAQDFLGTAGIRCRLRLPVELPTWPLTAEVRHNLFLAFKESLNNVVKHAAASEVQVLLRVEPEAFVLSVKDDGCGMALDLTEAKTDHGPGRIAEGNGLENMRQRLEEIGGTCNIQSAPRAGTKVTFLVPINVPV